MNELRGPGSVAQRRWCSWRSMAIWGPGMLAALADTDAGNVVAAAKSGEQWGYRLVPLLLMLIPALYMVQELTVRLGVYSGRGYGELIRERLGTRWAALSLVGLAVATIGSLITEFTAVAGVGEMYGLARQETLPIAAALLFGVVLSGTWRRVERIALVVGLCELVFFYVACAAHPEPLVMVRHATDWPLGNRAFTWSAAALIGSVFNPWMVFYQQAAVANRHRHWDYYRDACRDTAIGAVLTQLLTAAVLVASAATVVMVFYQQAAVANRHRHWDYYRDACRDTAIGAVLTQLLTAAVLVASAATVVKLHAEPHLETIGDISEMLSATLGTQVGRAVFGFGVLGASMVAAIVASLALAWGVDEWATYDGGARSATGGQRGGKLDRWFLCTYASCVTGSAAVVWLVPDLVSLTVDIQVVNAFMLPFVIGMLIALAVKVLPRALRPRGVYLWSLIAILLLTSSLGLFCAIAGIF